MGGSPERRRARTRAALPRHRCSAAVAARHMDPYAYHFDLRTKPLEAGVRLEERLGYLERITANRLQTNPVTVIQLGLGTLQLRDSGQLPLVAAVVEWLERS